MRRTVSVAGVTFEGRPAILARVYDYQEAGGIVSVALEREPSNRYDENAIKVLASLGTGAQEHINYVPKQTAIYYKYEALPTAGNLRVARYGRPEEPPRYSATLELIEQEREEKTS